MISHLFLIIILGLVTYRVSRFLVLDTLIDEIRDRVIGWLEPRQHRLGWRKLLDLLGCPYCITVWVAAGAVAAHHFIVDPVPMPVWTWLGVATVSLAVWAVIDNEEKPPT